jgi:hypothetical protein
MRITTLPRILRVVTLSVLPFVFAAVCWMMEAARGPLWLGTNSDPSYAYLLNGLLFAHGVTPGHVDHPGTTSQVIGAVVFRAAAFGRDMEEHTVKVLAEAEPMLEKIIRLHWMLAVGVLLFGGLLVAKRADSLGIALAMQLLPLLQLESYRALLFFAPEALLFALTFLLAGLLIARGYAGSEPRMYSLDIALAVTAAAGLATKVTFAPLCMLPILLQPSGRGKILMAALIGVAVTGFLWPIRGELLRMLAWFESLATHQGIYGGGPRGFADWSAYPRQLLRVATATRWLVPVVAGSVVIACAAVRNRDSHERARGWAKALFKCAVVQCIGLLLVAKHPHHLHYVLPLSLSCAFNVVACLEITRSWRWPRFAVSAFFAIIVFAIGITVHDILQESRGLREAARAQLEMKRRAEEIAAVRVDYYRSSSPEFALFFGDSFSRHFFGRSLDALYPGRVFFNVFEGRFETFRHRLPVDKLAVRGPVLMHGSSSIDLAKLPPGIATVPIADNGTVRLFRLEWRPHLQDRAREREER